MNFGCEFVQALSQHMALEDLNARWRASGDLSERFGIVREAYSIVTPTIMRGRTNPYFLDWTYHRSPIEELAWADIRRLGLPLYPQYPVLQYFVDFGDPRLKLAVELDGKAFHERQRDRLRDERLWEHGWRTFRIPGRKAIRSSNDVAERIADCMSEGGAFHELMEWGTTCGEGVLWALGYWYYGKAGFSALPQERVRNAAEFILMAHQNIGFPLDD